jgi:hypothetical protein
MREVPAEVHTRRASEGLGARCAGPGRPLSGSGFPDPKQRGGSWGTFHSSVPFFPLRPSPEARTTVSVSRAFGT